ncbi:hypothetical protein [Lysinibacillus sp. FSL K6-0102]|uniref:hypothetical protein n=1 Tax=Lysinibacillus sp. FSL K6-0102 TaxID=2975290 RepID=UPI0030FB1795
MKYLNGMDIRGNIVTTTNFSIFVYIVEVEDKIYMKDNAYGEEISYVIDPIFHVQAQ